jgi:hypothetical protein
MPFTPPPYNQISGLTLTDYKHVAVNLANYDSKAKPGQLVVDLATYTLYIGNADGYLNQVAGGGSGSPGGLTTQVQYNNSGSFAGKSTFTFNNTTNTLNISNISSVNTDMIIAPPANYDLFITATGAAGGIQLQGGNNILSLQQGSPELEMRVDQFNVGINANTDGDIFFDLSDGGNSEFAIATGNSTWTFNSTGGLTGSDDLAASLTISGPANLQANNNTINGNVFLTGTREETQGNSYILGLDADTSNIGYDSTLYYNHDNEELHLGNLILNDNFLGVEISTDDPDVNNGYINFAVSSGSSFTIKPTRAVKYSAISPRPVAGLGDMYFDNDTANGTRGFYLSQAAAWDKIMVATASGNVVQLPGNTSAPTAVAGGIYYNSTSKVFYMCANTSLGWQTVNLT